MLILERPLYSNSNSPSSSQWSGFLRRLTLSPPTPDRTPRTSMSHRSETADMMERPIHEERMHHPKSAKLFQRDEGV